VFQTSLSLCLTLDLALHSYRRKRGIWGGKSQPPSEKFENEITDDRRDHSNCRIDLSKNIFDGPSQTPSPTHTRARKFPHQKIGIKEEDYKTDLGYGSPDIFFHPLHLNVLGVPTPSGLLRLFHKEFRVP
jgi:hypothetical protein